jgi:hypothetical protein
MATDREKEREAELESAMYTNCLLLGLDLAVLGSPSSPAAGPRVGLFRHSNPRLGEQLLYFLLSSLRGPAQSAKDFDKVWPIFDSAQSREFRKIVQGIISELEQQGALPRSNSRVSSLATCCGPRLVPSTQLHFLGLNHLLVLFLQLSAAMQLNCILETYETFHFIIEIVESSYQSLVDLPFFRPCSTSFALISTFYSLNPRAP